MCVFVLFVCVCAKPNFKGATSTVQLASWRLASACERSLLAVADLVDSFCLIIALIAVCTGDFISKVPHQLFRRQVGVWGLKIQGRWACQGLSKEEYPVYCS